MDPCHLLDGHRRARCGVGHKGGEQRRQVGRRPKVRALQPALARGVHVEIGTDLRGGIHPPLLERLEVLDLHILVVAPRVLEMCDIGRHIVHLERELRHNTCSYKYNTREKLEQCPGRFSGHKSVSHQFTCCDLSVFLHGFGGCSIYSSKKNRWFTEGLEL